MRAPVFEAVGEPLRVEDLDLAGPGPDQVRVRVEASGVCHSDLSVRDGVIPYAAPLVLGHEGAGVVEEVGADVTRVAPGDHVVIAALAPCGSCFHCRRSEPTLCTSAMARFGAPYASRAGGPVGAGFGTATFGEETVVAQRNVVPIDRGLPFEQAALLGCAVSTGVGAAVHTAGIRPGQSVAVIGCGGVGIAALMGARLAGATPILAVDVIEGKLERARAAGATEVAGGGAGDPREVASKLTECGVDHAIEAAGTSSALATAFALTRPGGVVTLVGAGPDEPLPVSAGELIVGAKSVLGSLYGEVDPDRDVPWLVDLALQGRLDLELLVSRRVALDEVEDAFVALGESDVARSVIVRS